MYIDVHGSFAVYCNSCQDLILVDSFLKLLINVDNVYDSFVNAVFNCAQELHAHALFPKLASFVA